MRDINDPDWRDFCNGAFAPYEIKWNKKIEDYIREREEAGHENEDEDHTKEDSKPEEEEEEKEEVQ